MRNRLANIGSISVVTPCFNEEASLPLLFSRLNDLEQMFICENVSYEFVLVNDGSTDKTGMLLDEQARQVEAMRIVHRERNGGFGAALKTGFLGAAHDIVVTVDADTNYDCRDIPTMLEYLVDNVDMVTGSIFAPGADWNYPAHRFAMSRSLVELYRRALRGRGDHINTFTCGFRAYRREALLQCQPEAEDFIATAEILVRFLMNSFTVVEYPCTNDTRKFGVSKLRTFRTIANHLQFLNKIYRASA